MLFFILKAKNYLIFVTYWIQILMKRIFYSSLKNKIARWQPRPKLQENKPACQCSIVCMQIHIRKAFRNLPHDNRSNL